MPYLVRKINFIKYKNIEKEHGRKKLQVSYMQRVGKARPGEKF